MTRSAAWRRRGLGGALIAALVLLLTGLPATAETLVAHVMAQRGTASVERGGERLDLQPEDVLYASDVVITGADGRAKLRFLDGTIIALGADSRLALARMAKRAGQADSRGLVELLLGIIRATVAASGPGGGLDVETRTAVASSRSTAWMIEATADSTAVVVLDGRVRVDGAAGGSVILERGEGTDVAAGQPPKAPARWGASRVRSFLERTRLE